MEKVKERLNVTCRLAPDDVAFLDKLAEAMDRDRSYLIKQAVSEYISLHRWQIDEIEQAIKEAEAGDFATDAEVQAVFDKYK